MSHSSPLAKWTLPLFATAGLVITAAAAPAASAANLPVEISTAATHAHLASKAGKIETVHMHLHHTLNCLVGPKGSAFDKKELDPCAGLGNGAIPDAKNAAEKKSLHTAVRIAESGLKTDNLSVAQKFADETSMMLKKIK